MVSTFQHMFRKILQFCITIYSYGWKRLQPFSCWKRYPSSSFFLELLLKFAMFCMTAQFMSTNNVFYIEYGLVQIHNWIIFLHPRNKLLNALQTPLNEIIYFLYSDLELEASRIITIIVLLNQKFKADVVCFCCMSSRNHCLTCPLPITQ